MSQAAVACSETKLKNTLRAPCGRCEVSARSTDIAELQVAVGACANALLGTTVAASAPLMSVGLDSIAATEFTSAISDKLSMSVSAIMLFDYPTVDSIASHLASEVVEDGETDDVWLRPSCLQETSGIGEKPPVLGERAV